VQRLALAIVAALAAALVVVSLSAAAAEQSRATRPHRIVSLSPTITEDLFAVGAGKQVIAVDDQSNYPRRAPRTKLSGYTPNIEAIAKYRPDLVLISSDNPGSLVSQLREVGIKAVNEPAASDLDQAYGEILQLGRLTGHRQGAKSVVSSMRTHLAAIVESVPKTRRHLRVYHELDQTYYSATSKTFIGRIYQLFGFKNIADAADSTGSGYPQLSAEYIVQQDPQIIVLADTKCCQQNQETVAARPGWSTITAVRHHRVVGVSDDIASRWGPRIVQFAQAVARIARQG
jgi:iron complex transport system substrate-binding protein